MATSRPEPKPIHVFIASPGDLAVERRAFKAVIDELNSGFGDGAGIRFVALGWEDTLATTGRRAQSVINQDIDRSDVFVLALHRRWGQEAPDAYPYSSYTEEEFHRAIDRWKKTGSPEVFVFFKDVDPGSMADAGPQLQKVLDFRKSLEDTRQVLYRFFEDEKAFTAEVDRHLRAYARGELPKTDAPREAVVLPLEYILEVTKAKAEAHAAAQRDKQAEAAIARAEELALALAEQAAKAAFDGRVEEARQTFAKAHEGTTNLQVLSLAYEFYNREGDLDTAEQILERRLAISGREAETGETATTYGNLGLIYRKRGDLNAAEAMYLKALAIAEKLCLQEAMANQYSNLGLIYQTRGELDQAEGMHQKALAIAEKLNNQEEMAIRYENLGLIYWNRRDVDAAEAMHRKALAINEKLGHLDRVAIQYDNLAAIAVERGDLKVARELRASAKQLRGRTQPRHDTVSGTGRPFRLFYSYSHKDEPLRKELETHLKILNRQGLIDLWHDRLIGAGDEWKDEISSQLENADIILLLISADFIASDYCYDLEMVRALERHAAGEAVVIPVILRDVNWDTTPFGKLQALPKDGKPVTKWRPKDSAWRNVSEGIERVVQRLRLLGEGA